MPIVNKELTYRINELHDELLVRLDLIGNLELTYRETNCSVSSEHYTFVPKEFIPQLIEVLKELSK